MRPIARVGDQSRPHRVQRHVAHCGDEMRLVHRHRTVAALEDMPGPARPRVDETGIEPMGAGERQREALRVGGRQDEVDVVGHLAIGPNRDAEAPAGLGEPVAVERIVVFALENPLAAIAALGDVVGRSGNDDAGDASHAGWIT
jgi:hypothetical protein